MQISHSSSSNLALRGDLPFEASKMGRAQRFSPYVKRQHRSLQDEIVKRYAVQFPEFGYKTIQRVMPQIFREWSAVQSRMRSLSLDSFPRRVVYGLKEYLNGNGNDSWAAVMDSDRKPSYVLPQQYVEVCIKIVLVVTEREPGSITDDCIDKISGIMGKGASYPLDGTVIKEATGEKFRQAINDFEAFKSRKKTLRMIAQDKNVVEFRSTQALVDGSLAASQQKG